MRIQRSALVLATFLGVAHADDRPTSGILEGRIVEGESLHAVEGATVVVTDELGGPVVASGLTSPTGWFRYRLPPGKYNLLAMFGEARWLHAGVVVQTGKTVQIPGVLAIDQT